MKRKAAATWIGGPKEGRGELRSESGTLANSRYSFDARFENGRGTNPEELIGAAHAGCYSMALSKVLSEKGIDAARIDTEATVTLENSGDGFGIPNVHLDTRIEAPAAEPKEVESAAAAAREGCLVSQLLDTEITLRTTLVN